MERNSVLNLLFLLIFCLFMGGFFIVYQLEEPETYTAPVIATPAAPDWIRLTGEGASMEPWLPDGASYRAYPADVPVVGDIVAFDCLATKCIHDGRISYTKFLRKIDSRGCFWFEGRTDEYMYNGVRSVSFDSTEYGYLCSGDFKVLGVVRDLPEEGKH